MRRSLLEELRQATRERHPLALVTDLGTGDQRLADRALGVAESGIEPEVLAAVRESLRSDQCRTLRLGERELFIQPINPPLRMVIVGAVHIAQSLVPFAAQSGFEVTVVDPRRAFSTDARFPGVRISQEWPDEALRGFALDARSAVVTLTHDPKLDDPALAAALASEAFYVGALGSRRTHASRIERLKERGLDDAALGRIHAPVGLAIGAESTAEIAVSIMAEIVKTLRAPH
jgi:xanthine dehydrogenase accessory factor